GERFGAVRVVFFERGEQFPGGLLIVVDQRGAGRRRLLGALGDLTGVGIGVAGIVTACQQRQQQGGQPWRESYRHRASPYPAAPAGWGGTPAAGNPRACLL